VRLLLDTHALAWAVGAPERLSDSARAALEDPATLLFLSPVSVWEMSIKFKQGRWPEVAPFLDEALYKEFLSRLRAEEVCITSRHTRLAGQFSAEHRDPFDRLLAAQSIEEGMAILSCDAALDNFPLTRLW
jgi:PIN domain nuclease of toxin-antitoxin system